MLLGSSLIIAIAAILDAFGVVPFQGVDRMEAAGATWVFWDSMWRSVLYFLPVMVAYNASKALKVDPWIGGDIMAALFTPEFLSLKEAPDHRLHHEPDAGYRSVRRAASSVYRCSCTTTAARCSCR